MTMQGFEMDSQNQEMRFDGISASPGIAIGEGLVYRKEMPVLSSNKIESSAVPEQIERFTEAKETLIEELMRLRRKEIDKATLEIIDAQIEMVKDPELHDRVVECIKKDQYEVGFAIEHVFESFLDVMEKSGNENTRDRIVDVKDVRDRLIQLAHNYNVSNKIVPGSIIISDELSPREVIQLSGRNIKGIIMDRGGETSHASIIAHSMGIPCVVGVKKASKALGNEVRVIVDGTDGVIIADPKESTVKEYESKLEDYDRQLEKVRDILERPSITPDGQEFVLRANIEFVEELVNVERYRAEGLGLVRTESIYLSKKDFEYYENQEQFYVKLLEGTGSKPVTIRLFDAGGDKFFSLNNKEKNPFLGWRGIRMLLDEKDVLSDQLRAILKVAGRYPGRIRILVPMISSLEEIIRLKEELFAVEGDLIKEGIQIDEEIAIGIMVEVPSVALLADKIAPHVDFFSIGTNDLTQYTLAVDRGNELISGLFQQIHPAVWKLIDYTVNAAERHDIDVSVCGELASYPDAAACLLGMGIFDLSMSPTSIPKVKSVLTSNNFTDMVQLSRSVLDAENTQDIEKLFENWKN